MTYFMPVTICLETLHSTGDGVPHPPGESNGGRKIALGRGLFHCYLQFESIDFHRRCCRTDRCRSKPLDDLRLGGDEVSMRLDRLPQHGRFRMQVERNLVG